RSTKNNVQASEGKMKSGIAPVLAVVFLNISSIVYGPTTAVAVSSNMKSGRLALQGCRDPGCSANVAVGFAAMQGPNSACTTTGIPFACCTGASRGTCTQSSYANTAVGYGALLSNSTGSADCALGTETLYLNTSGSNNTAVGLAALFSNTT